MGDLNKAIITAIPIEIAQGDDTCKYATFLISVLDEYDRMGRMIPKEAGEMYHETLRGFPIVAKLIKDRLHRPVDFGAHEMHKTVKRNGETEVYFDTYPIGSVVDTWIEDREVAGYEGIKSCIMARAKLWTCRSPEYFKVLDKLWEEHAVSSSWELVVTDSEETSLGRKILRAFSFIGNALLGTTSIPAVRGAGIYEYAEAEEEICQTTAELNEALLKDICEQEDVTLDTENKDTMPVEETVTTEQEVAQEIAPVAETAEEPAAEAVVTEAESTTEPTPEATPDAEEGTPATADITDVPASEPVIVSDDANKLAELQAALISANDENVKLRDEIARLQGELDALAPIKAEYERLEAEKAEAERQRQIAELKQYALDSKMIKEAELADEGGDETVRGLIANLDKAGLESLIVQRLISSYTLPTIRQYSTASVEKKTVSVRTNISDDTDEKLQKAARADMGEDIVRAVINR